MLATIEDQRVQLLRFDMFHKQPHYHYAPNGQNLRYDLDALALEEDGVAWVINLLKRKLPALLTKAGYRDLLGSIDVNASGAALSRIEERWRAQSPADASTARI